MSHLRKRPLDGNGEDDDPNLRSKPPNARSTLQTLDQEGETKIYLEALTQTLDLPKTSLDLTGIRLDLIEIRLDLTLE